MGEEYLFDPAILDSFDRTDLRLPPHLSLRYDSLSSFHFSLYDPKVDILNKSILRPLKLGDNALGFLKLLEQLTKVGEIDGDMFRQRFENMKRSKCYFVMVVDDKTQSDKIIGTATLILEQKFIRECALKGRVEEVSNHR